MRLTCICILLLLLFYSGFAETKQEDESSLLEYLYGLYNSINPLYTEGNYQEIIELLTPLVTNGTSGSIDTDEIVYDNLPGENDKLSEIQEVFLVLAWYKAMGYYFLEEYEEAQVYFRIVLDYYPYVDGRFFGYYAQSFRRRGKTEKAYTILEQGLSLLKEDKDKAIIYWYFSSFFYEDGDYSQAIEAGRKGYTYDYTFMGPVYYEFLAQLQLNNNKEALSRLFIIFYEYSYQNSLEYLSEISHELNNLLEENPDHRGIITALWFISAALGDTGSERVFQKVEKTLIDDDLLVYVPQPQGIHYYLLSLYFSKTGDHDKSQDYAHYCYATGAGLVNYDGIAQEYYFQKDENNRVVWSGENYLYEKTRQLNTTKKDVTGKTDAELVLQLGHSHAIWGLDVNSTGNLVLSASLDNTIKLWRTDGRLLRTFKGHTDDVNKAVFIPGSTTIVSAGQDKSIRFWDMDGKCIRLITDAHPDKVDTIAVNNSGNRIITTSMFYKPELSKDVTLDLTSNNNVSIKIWSQQGDHLHTKEIENIECVNDTVFSPDGRFFYTAHGHFLFGTGDNLVRVWNAEGTLISELTGHIDVVNCVAASPDGDIVISGSKNGEIIIWNIHDKYSKVIGASPDSINDVAFSPDNQLFATVSGKYAGGEGDETLK
ncbi:MAG: hypothetical protein JXJ04_20930, partial [Spirochaetales bacterium]|nr:hypothetical protein [Spirochaetales bacterium]